MARRLRPDVPYFSINRDDRRVARVVAEHDGMVLYHVGEHRFRYVERAKFDARWG